MIGGLYDIAEKDGVVKANEVLIRSVNEVTVIFLFSLWNDPQDYYITAMRSGHTYFNGKLPLIHDECKRMELKRLKDVHSKRQMKSFPSVILSGLEDQRYINYTFENVSESSKTQVQEDLNSIYNALTEAFPCNICFYGYYASRASIDTVSVSFYSLSDVMPIFDSKRSMGVGMEIFLANSNTSYYDLMTRFRSATYRFLFTKDKENIFTIDGEAVRRSHDRPSSQCMTEIQTILCRDVAKDK
jgi:hypothetical protein